MHFGMKSHIGADAESGLVHTVRGTSGNVHYVVEGSRLLHGQETYAFGDAEQLSAIARQLNERPRKTLGCHTPPAASCMLPSYASTCVALNRNASPLLVHNQGGDWWFRNENRF